MARKKKQEENIYEEDFDIEEDIDDENEEPEIEDNKGIPEMEEIPENPMGLAYQISKESETVKNFKELPREVKYSFYDPEEKREVKHFARTYRDYKYIEKIIDLRTKEDEQVINHREELLKINNLEQLKNYFKVINRDYLLTDIDDLDNNDLINLLEHIRFLKENYMLNRIDKDKKKVTALFNEYNETHNTPEYIDDMGNLGKVMDTSLTSMGYKGNASNTSVMTIQAVKNEDIQKQADDKTRFSFIDAIKRKLG